MDTEIENCYNIQNLEGICPSGENNIGGICGSFASSSGYNTENCYNTGELISMTSGILYLGEICGTNYKGIVSNCYYKMESGNEGVGKTNGGVSTTAPIDDMTSVEFVEELNSTQSETIWKKGTTCPELYWE